MLTQGIVGTVAGTLFSRVPRHSSLLWPRHLLLVFACLLLTACAGNPPTEPAQ